MIAFDFFMVQILELSATYCPEVSAYKVLLVLEYQEGGGGTNAVNVDVLLHCFIFSAHIISILYL